MTTIQTRNKVPFDLAEPQARDVYIEDVVWSLSQQCRWGGHTDRFYSVAQHSVLCSRLFDDPELSYAALLHDAHEAYVGDVSRPIKQLLGEAWTELENRVATVVAGAFGLSWPPPPEVIEADDSLLHGEVRERMGGAVGHWTTHLPYHATIGDCWEPGLARHLFLERYTLLTLMRDDDPPPQPAEAALGPDDVPPRRHLAGAAEPSLATPVDRN